MTARNLGSLDAYLGGAAAFSKQSPKIFSYSVAGQNPDVDIAVVEDVWEDGGRYDYLTTASVLTLVSTSANDAPTLGGIDTVEIVGCDVDFKVLVETVTLNGLTPVVTVNEFFRVFNLNGHAANAADVNATAIGKITAQVAANIQGSIFAGSSTSRHSFISVLAGYTGFVDLAFTSGGPGDDFVMTFGTRIGNNSFTTGSEIEISNSSLAVINFSPIVGNVPEKSDIKVEAMAINNNAQVRITYILTMIRNDYLTSLTESI